MSSTTSNTGTTSAHDADAAPVAGDPKNFPSHAELVRTLLGRGGFGSLTTMTEAGYPYGSLAAFSVLGDGALMMCLSEMAEHTRNARHTHQAGMFVASGRSDDQQDPLDEPRVSMLGDLREFSATHEDIEGHLAVHPQTANYMNFSDFGWWRLEPVSARFVGGFGSMSWVGPEAIAAAEPDPVLPHARAAIDHMNADHSDANLDMARHLAELPTATKSTVHAIDRHGVTLYVDTTEGFRVARLAYLDGALDDAGAVRGAVVALTKRARELGAST